MQIFKRTKWFDLADVDKITAVAGRMPAVFVVVTFSGLDRFFDEYDTRFYDEYSADTRLASEDNDDCVLEERVNELVSSRYGGYDFAYRRVELDGEPVK